MSEDVRFGKSQTEDDLKKIMVCRDIVRQIMDYGVTQKQILMLIQLLGYELENHEQMTEIVAMTKVFLEGDGFLIDNGASNGPTS